MLATALLAVPLTFAAGDVHVVPTPGLYDTIQQAIDAASDGDLVIVEQGSHIGFEIAGKGVGVAAAPEAFVWVSGAIVVRDTAAHQSVVLHRLRTDLPSADGLVVSQCAGDVRISVCTLRGRHALLGSLASWAGARVTDSDSVVISGSELTGGQGDLIEDEIHQFATSPGGAGLHVVRSNVAVYSTQLLGGRGGEVLDTTPADGGDGGAGVLADASIVFLSSSKATGGHGGTSDCEIFPFAVCGQHGDGGHGLEVVGGAVAERRATALAGGDAHTGSPFGPSAGAPGKPVHVSVGSTTINGGPDMSYTATSPVYPGELAYLRVRGPAGHLAIAAIGFGPIAPVPLLSGAGPLCLSPSGALVLPLGALPASGFATFALTPPPAGGLPIAATLYTQGVMLDPVTASLHFADASQFALVDAIP